MAATHVCSLWRRKKPNRMKMWLSECQPEMLFFIATHSLWCLRGEASMVNKLKQVAIDYNSSKWHISDLVMRYGKRIGKSLAPAVYRLNWINCCSAARISITQKRGFCLYGWKTRHGMRHGTRQCTIISWEYRNAHLFSSAAKRWWQCRGNDAVLLYSSLCGWILTTFSWCSCEMEFVEVRRR